MTESPDSPDTPEPLESPEPADTPPPEPDTPPQPAPASHVIPCARCGYNISGQRIGTPCPECGVSITLSPMHDAASGKAVASFVLGILSLVTCVYYGVPGIVCGIIAMHYAKRVRAIADAGNASPISVSMGKAGRVCGLTGLILSSLFLALMALYIIFIIGIVGAATWGRGGGGGPPIPVPFP